MIVVPVRVVILHHVPISTHNIFYNPLYSPKPLQILQILQILQSYRHLTDNVPAHVVHSYNCAGCTGPPIFFVHLAQVAASLRSAGAGNRAAGGREGLGAAASRARGHAGTARFLLFLPGKVKIFRPEKVSKNLLAHSAPSPNQFYGMEPCEMAREKWGAASPRSCVPLSQMSQ